MNLHFHHSSSITCTHGGITFQDMNIEHKLSSIISTPLLTACKNSLHDVKNDLHATIEKINTHTIVFKHNLENE